MIGHQNSPPKNHSLMKNPDISIILPVDDDAMSFRRAVMSLEVAAHAAARDDITVELIIVVSRCSRHDAAWTATYHPDIFACVRIVHSDADCLAAARNDAIAQSNGSNLLIFNGYDLLSTNAFVDLIRKIRPAPNPTIVIPGYSVHFGPNPYVERYFDLSVISPLALMRNHYYPTVLLAPRHLFENVQFQRPPDGAGPEQEDWTFLCDAVAAGYDVVTASNTLLFRRQSYAGHSPRVRNPGQYRIPTTNLFTPERFRRAIEQRPGASIAVSESDDWRAEIRSFVSGDVYRSLISEMNMIDPSVSIGSYHPQRLVAEPRPTRFPADLYLRTWAALEDSGYTDIFVLPALTVGGSEKYLIQVMHSLFANDRQTRILVVCHDPNPGPINVDHLPPGTDLFDLWNLGYPIERDDHFIVLAALLSAGPSARLHLKTSGFIFNFFSQGYSVVLNRHKVVYYRFCDDRHVLDSNIITGPNRFNFIIENFSAIDLIVSDHQKLIEYDRDRLKISPDKWSCLRAYCPVTMTNDQARHARQKTNYRVLWASRLVWQKNPLILVLISEILDAQNIPLIIDIYGSSASDSDPFDPLIFDGCTHLSYKGAYKNFNEINASNYDAFIYTSMFDGLPNVVLEAMAAGLPVIAPDSDGLPEIIQHGKSGFLVPYGATPLETAVAYCRFLSCLISDVAFRMQAASNGLALIARHHSIDQHRRRTNEIFSAMTQAPASIIPPQERSVWPNTNNEIKEFML